MQDAKRSPKTVTLVEYDQPLRIATSDLGEPNHAASEDIRIDSVAWVRTPQCEAQKIDLRVRIEQQTASDAFIGRIFDERHYVKNNKSVFPGEYMAFQIEGVKLGDTIRLLRNNIRVIEV